MIKDKLNNSKVYFALSENIRKGFEWLLANKESLKNIKPDRYIIDGDNVWANVQIYNTKGDADYEAHRKYVDIQYMIEGNEIAGVTDITNCTTTVEYNQEKDIEFLHSTVEEEYQELNEGEFLLFYPHDAHKPSINPGETKTVKKVVVKAAIN